MSKMSQECHSNIDATSLRYRVGKCLRDLTIFILRMLKTQNILTTLIPNGGVGVAFSVPVSAVPVCIHMNVARARSEEWNEPLVFASSLGSRGGKDNDEKNGGDRVSKGWGGWIPQTQRVLRG